VKKQQVGKQVSEDDLLEIVLDAGAEEVNDLGENFEVVTSPTALSTARDALKGAGIEYESADVSFLPTVSVSVDAEIAKSVFELIDAIEDLEDVQNVYGNFDVSDEVMASLA
jgi:transcriptional/translational regulatory protein YebC/TACO1